MKFNFCPICKSGLSINPEGYLGCVDNTCNYVYYQNPTPVVAAIVEHQPKTVILAHNRAWPQNFFGLITGFLEKNEHPAEAVLREVKEELDLDGEIGSFVGHYTFERMNQLIIAYHVKAKGTVTLNEELDEYKHVDFDKVKAWPAGTGYALKDFLEDLGYEVPMLQWPKRS